MALGDCLYLDEVRRSLQSYENYKLNSEEKMNPFFQNIHNFPPSEIKTKAPLLKQSKKQIKKHSNYNNQNIQKSSLHEIRYDFVKRISALRKQRKQIYIQEMRNKYLPSSKQIFDIESSQNISQEIVENSTNEIDQLTPVKKLLQTPEENPHCNNQEFSFQTPFSVVETTPIKVLKRDHSAQLEKKSQDKKRRKSYSSTHKNKTFNPQVKKRQCLRNRFQKQPRIEKILRQATKKISQKLAMQGSEIFSMSLNIFQTLLKKKRSRGKRLKKKQLAILQLQDYLAIQIFDEENRKQKPKKILLLIFRYLIKISMSYCNKKKAQRSLLESYFDEGVFKPPPSYLMQYFPEKPELITIVSMLDEYLSLSPETFFNLIIYLFQLKYSYRKHPELQNLLSYYQFQVFVLQYYTKQCPEKILLKQISLWLDSFKKKISRAYQLEILVGRYHQWRWLEGFNGQVGDHIIYGCRIVKEYIEDEFENIREQLFDWNFMQLSDREFEHFYEKYTKLCQNYKRISYINCKYLCVSPLNVADPETKKQIQTRYKQIKSISMKNTVNSLPQSSLNVKKNLKNMVSMIRKMAEPETP